VLIRWWLCGGCCACATCHIKIDESWISKIGKVKELPTELRKMESETMVRVAIVDIDGKQFEIPRSNLEVVEID